MPKNEVENINFSKAIDESQVSLSKIFAGGLILWMGLMAMKLV